MQPVKVEAFCDCGGLYCVREAIASNPLRPMLPKFKHECSACGDEWIADVAYPTMLFEEIDHA